MSPRLLITRAEPGAGATAAAVKARGGVALLCPLFVIKRMGRPLPDFSGAQAIAFTSAHAVRAAGLAPKDLPAFAVGAGAAKAAVAAGFATVYSAEGDGQALANLLTARLRPDGGAIVYLHGEARAFDLTAALGANGFVVRPAVLYAAEEVSTLVPEQAAAAAEANAVLLHSPRGGAAAARLLAPFASHLSAICISEATAVPARTAGFRAIHVAQRPSEEALLACAFAQTDAQG